MTRLLALLGFVLSLWWAAPAAAAIGTPTNLANGSCFATGTPCSGTSLAITVASQPANTFIVVQVAIKGAGVTATTLTDSGGNTYTRLNIISSTNLSQAFFYTSTTVATGTTLTANFSGTPALALAPVYSVSGIACSPLDINGAGTTSTGTSPSIATGTLAQASEIIWGGTIFLSAAGTYTESASFTNRQNNTNFSVAGEGLGSDTTAATTTVTYAPAITSSEYVANVASFKGGTCPSSNAQGMSLRGSQ